MEIKVENTENKNEVKISFKVEAEKFENAIKDMEMKFFTKMHLMN